MYKTAYYVHTSAFILARRGPTLVDLATQLPQEARSTLADEAVEACLTLSSIQTGVGPTRLQVHLTVNTLEQ